LEQRRLADEHEVVGVWEVLEEKAQFAQAVGLHEVSVVNDGDKHFAGAAEAEGFLNQEAFAVVVAALELDLKGLAGVSSPKGGACASTAALMEPPANQRSSKDHNPEAFTVWRGSTSARKMEKVRPQPPRWPRGQHQTRWPR